MSETFARRWRVQQPVTARHITIVVDRATAPRLDPCTLVLDSWHSTRSVASVRVCQIYSGLVPSNVPSSERQWGCMAAWRHPTMQNRSELWSVQVSSKWESDWHARLKTGRAVIARCIALSTKAHLSQTFHS